MHHNRIWLAFLSTVSLIVVWFTGVTGHQLFHYFAMSSETDPLEIEWHVEGRSSDRYFLTAKYRFGDNHKVYKGETTFEKTAYRNSIAGEKALKEYKMGKWRVFYSSRNPEISTLENLFPFKSCFYTGVLWGLLIYFFWLGFYVQSILKSDFWQRQRSRDF